jgi:ferrous iron transport protein B
MLRRNQMSIISQNEIPLLNLDNRKESVVFIGKESVGKSQLISSLTKKLANASKFQGSTISVEKYETDSFIFIDTPGIIQHHDALTTKLALLELKRNEKIILVISATHIDQDLQDLLPIVKNKTGMIIITQWDRIKADQTTFQKLEMLQQELKIPLIPVNAKNLDSITKKRILDNLGNSATFDKESLEERFGYILEPKKSIFDIFILGQLVALMLLVLPMVIAVNYAIQFSDYFYDYLEYFIDPLLIVVNSLPSPLNYWLGRDYGAIAMFPFLLLYALPTILIFSIVISVYKSSGLIDQISLSLDPIFKHFGLTGRDLVRVIMGFGCNVPAVVNSRACSTCSRKNCVSAISFGSACSYQLPASIAVFIAIGFYELIFVYLLLLGITTLIYIRLIRQKPILKENFDDKKLQESLLNRTFMQYPSIRSIWFNARSDLKQFVFLAFPVFAFICILSGTLQWLGLLEFISLIFSPVMIVFNLPNDSTFALILGSIRKDGIAIALLDTDWNTLRNPEMTRIQVLTIIYLSSVLLPCIVTLFTIIKEMSVKFAAKMVSTQMIAAVLFTVIIAWGGNLIFS